MVSAPLCLLWKVALNTALLRSSHQSEEVSRPMADVLSEINDLAAQGVREINLLGQMSMPTEERCGRFVCDFAELIPYVADIDGTDRIRYTTSHPVEFSDALIEVYAVVQNW